MKIGGATVGKVVFWATWPALYLLLVRSKRTRVIVEAEGKILLVRPWLGSGQWELPGGGIHRGEAPAVAAARELEEETGVQVAPEDLELLSEERLRGYGLSFWCHTYVVRLPAAVQLRPQPSEILEASWLSTEDETVKSSLSPVTRTVVAAWRDSRALLK